METRLADWIRDSADGREADAILRSCVHCGFCNATCPTYQLLGDELDGPRGRIYQIKRMLEGAQPGAATRLHLDRCLTCTNCETTCPSGVRYGRLVEIGRGVLEQRAQRPAGQRLVRALLRHLLTQRALFGAGVRVGRALRAALPASVARRLPVLRGDVTVPRSAHARKVLLLRGCVQPALIPNIDAASTRVLDRLGIESVVAAESGCCGAIDLHLGAADAAQMRARRNIDAWWPHIEAGVEAIVINASGCAAVTKDYAHLLRDDGAYAAKAQRIVGLVRDIAEYLPPLLAQLANAHLDPVADAPRRVAFHPPCTLQHTQKIRGSVEVALRAFGADLVPVAEAHLCCGSAGTYSILQPALALRLRARKLDNLQRAAPEMILSSNIGCLAHLEPAAGVPVRHWIEWVDARLRP
ncbi:MAG: glycolate oxidase subunit GlcF [Rudaea sp.]